MSYPIYNKNKLQLLSWQQYISFTYLNIALAIPQVMLVVLSKALSCEHTKNTMDEVNMQHKHKWIHIKLGLTFNENDQCNTDCSNNLHQNWIHKTQQMIKYNIWPMKL